MRRMPSFTPNYDAARHRHDGFDIDRLECYGCARSPATAPWPGSPSGEKACLFCIRNPLHVQCLTDDHRWGDGSKPVGVPMDCYQTLDMESQMQVWLDEAENAGRDAVEVFIDLSRRLKRKPTPEEEAAAHGGH